MSQHLRRKLRRDETALAVNSAYGRTQNQLHIHIDCISPETRSALLKHLSTISTDWAALPIKLNGHTYRARRIYSMDLRNVNPFLLLAQEHSAQNNMRAQTLVIVGVKFENGNEGFIPAILILKRGCVISAIASFVKNYQTLLVKGFLCHEILK